MSKLIFTLFAIIFSLPISYAITSRDLLFEVAQQIQQLNDPDGKFKGITYNVTTDNTFAPNWLMQTPNVWGDTVDQVAYFLPGCPDCHVDFGLPACETDSQCNAFSPTGLYGHCLHLDAFYNGISGQTNKMCIGHSDQIIDRMYDMIIHAHHFVDITVLEPFPDIRFLAAIRDALTDLAVNNREVTVRIVEGLYPFGPPSTHLANEDPAVVDTNYLQALARDIEKIIQSQNSKFMWPASVVARI